MATSLEDIGMKTEDDDSLDDHFSKLYMDQEDDPSDTVAWSIQKAIPTTKTEIAQAATVARRTIAFARAKTNTQPTAGQKEYGNYSKGVLAYMGLRIRLENPKGSYRTGVDKSGTAWKVHMKHDYGYFIRRNGNEETPIGNDGDPVDVFIGPDLASQKVFIINQAKVGVPGKVFDEVKCVLGATTKPQAAAIYLSNYAKGWQKNIISIAQMDMREFQDWLTSGNTSKPVNP